MNKWVGLFFLLFVNLFPTKLKRTMNRELQTWLQILISVVTLLTTESSIVDITYVQSAVAKGAVCLDGSPPAYHLDRGFGEGINNWLVQIEGGAWCHDVSSCLDRSKMWLGSSLLMQKQIDFIGILSNNSRFNPDFYSWNRVKIRYCDGSSFTGDVEAVDPNTKLHFRGARVFLAVIEDLLEKGMAIAEYAMLSGCSAGGLTSILHCDRFRSLLPKSTRVKCISDAGYFINVKDISGAPYIEGYFDHVVATHGSSKNLPDSCTSKMKPGLCIFPENIVQEITTPLFILNSGYDSWQISNILVPAVADPKNSWQNCKDDLDSCSASELKVIEDFRSDFLNALSGILSNSRTRGYFINSCFAHCQTEMQEYWFGSHSPVLNDKKMAIAVGDWFYDRSSFQEIDCPYPCDNTCPVDHSSILLNAY